MRLDTLLLDEYERDCSGSRAFALTSGMTNVEFFARSCKGDSVAKPLRYQHNFLDDGAFLGRRVETSSAVAGMAQVLQ